jgi:hypothetical protein
MFDILPAPFCCSEKPSLKRFNEIDVYCCFHQQHHQNTHKAKGRFSYFFWTQKSLCCSLILVHLIKTRRRLLCEHLCACYRPPFSFQEPCFHIKKRNHQEPHRVESAQFDFLPDAASKADQNKVDSWPSGEMSVKFLPLAVLFQSIYSERTPIFNPLRQHKIKSDSIRHGLLSNEIVKIKQVESKSNLISLIFLAEIYGLNTNSNILVQKVTAKKEP